MPLFSLTSSLYTPQMKSFIGGTALTAFNTERTADTTYTWVVGVQRSSGMRGWIEVEVAGSDVRTN